MAGDSVPDHPNDNGPNMKLKNLYGNAILNWMRHHGTIKFIPAHINYIPISTWKAFKLSSATITQTSFKKTNISSLSP